MSVPMKKIIATTIIILSILTLTLGGCIQENLELDAVEIREYQGEKLSSVYDFRENSIKGPQYIDQKNYTLKITGLIEQPMNYSYEQLLNTFSTYKKIVTLYCVEGWNVKILWEGLLISDILQEVQPLPQSEMVIFHALDGYTTSLSIEYLEEKQILMAYKMNNVTLPPQRGYPFQLVAESKWGYKWIKWITEIELSDNSYYKGYWESRGYSNNADLNKSYFEE
jgi:DMSO/TMAO reductase YedYZ molybdopterin-dependent catalytic subunit